MKKRIDPILTVAFLLAELILYILLLTAGGTVAVVSSYISIVLCFLYALWNIRKENVLLICGLACTVAADYFLVVCSPREQLWGMIFFLGAQTLYAVRLHLSSRNRMLLIIRAGLILCAEAVTVLVLKDKTDALAVVSICYYVNLIMNTLEAFTLFGKNKLLPIGFVLFILCDTVIGLQVASGAYLPIGEDSLIHQIIFVDFNLAWLFYLPSQVLISLSSRKLEK